MENLAPVQMACPDCREMMTVVLPKLLSGAPVWCSGCGAKMTVDLEESRHSVRLLRGYMRRVDELVSRRATADPSTAAQRQS